MRSEAVSAARPALMPSVTERVTLRCPAGLALGQRFLVLLAEQVVRAVDQRVYLLVAENPGPPSPMISSVIVVSAKTLIIASGLRQGQADAAETVPGPHNSMGRISSAGGCATATGATISTSQIRCLGRSLDPPSRHQWRRRGKLAKPQVSGA
jgi:hypothetical protein